MQNKFKNMNMQNKFKINVKENVHSECQTISDAHKLKQEEFKDIQVLLYKFKPIFKALNFCFQIQGHSRTFKFVRTLYV